MSSASGIPARIRQRYDVIETVGRGGQGRVVKAVDTRHDRVVALKIRRLPADPLEAERSLAEVRTLLELPSHPGLPVVRDDFFEDGLHVVVLDWVDGIDLGQLLAADGTPGLPPTTVLRWAAQAAEALTHLHRNDPPTVHGDVKPSNLVLDRHGRIVVVDYGVSSTPGRIQRGGTPGYRAPELRAGTAPTPAADVYGLAATVFALLTGEPPSGVLPAWQGVDPDRARRMEAALRRGLSIDPSRRPATVGAFVESLAAGEAETWPTGTVTVLSTRITEAAQRWEAHPLAMSGALARHEMLVDRIVESHGGRRVGGPLEDGATVSVFERAASAVRAAVALNNDLVGAGDPVIQICAGVHTGELVGRGAHGPTVLRAAAIRDLAGAGEVVLSDLTAALVAGEQPDGIGLVPLGSHPLPGVDEGVTVLAVSAVGLAVPPDPAVPPYPGLVPFSSGDADIFVGRDDAVAALRRLVAPGRVVAVLGASGVGKSSLLRAGLMAHLPEATLWVPGPEPLASWNGAGPGPIVVDQLEELLARRDDRAGQLAAVERLCGHPGGAVVALRADALAELARFPRLADAVAAHHVLLAPMRPDQLRAAIEEPAARRGLQLEAGLVELVLAEAGDEPGSLPLVAHAMRETWARRRGRVLTVAGYRRSGGVNGAIAATAETVFDGLSDADRHTMRSLLLRMVQPGDGNAATRRRVLLDELRELGDHEASARVIEQLAAARLVTVDRASVQPAHDALLRAWPRLADWIAERQDDLRLQRHLTATADAWARAGHDPAELYRGTRLQAAAELAGRSPLTETERSFVAASARAEAEERDAVAATNRRLRRLVVGVGLAFVLAVSAGVVAVVQLGRAADQRDRADAARLDAEVSRLSAEARAAAETSPDLALLLALEANRRADSGQTRSALLEALTAHPQLLAKLHGVDSGLEAVVWSPDSTVLAAPTSDSTGTLLWDGRTYERLAAPLATGEEFQLDFDAAFTPDGRTLVVAGVVEQRPASGIGSIEAVLQVWDTAARSLRATVPLVVVADHVLAADDRHAVVVGRPLPADVAVDELDPLVVAQTVDLAAGAALPPVALAGEPLLTSEAGTSVAVLSADGTITISDQTMPPGTARTLDATSLLGPSEEPSALGYDPVAGRVAIGTWAGQVLIAQPPAPSGEGPPRLELVGRIDTDGDPSSVISFSADGTLAAIGGYLGSTRVVQAASALPHGPPLGSLSSQVNDVAFNPGATRLAVAGLDGTGSVWSLDGTRSIGRPLAGHQDAVVAVMTTDDGATVVTASHDGRVIARAADTGSVRWSTDTAEPIWSAAVDGNGTRLALGGADGQLLVLDAATGQPAGAAKRYRSAVEALAWSPTAPLLAVAADRGVDQALHTVEFVDPASLEPAGEPVDTAGGTTVGLAFSPDGRRLAAVLDNNVVRVIDVAARSVEPASIESVDVPFFAVAWSPDGRRMATGTAGGAVELWDAQSLEPAAPAGRQSPLPVRGLAFSPDGTLLASTTEFATTRLWDVATGAPIGGELVAGPAPITIAAIPEPDRPEIPFAPTFSPDGTVLYTGSDHPMVWDLDPRRWRAAACAVAGRELTLREWSRHLPDQPGRSTCS